VGFAPATGGEPELWREKLDDVTEAARVKPNRLGSAAVTRDPASMHALVRQPVADASGVSYRIPESRIEARVNANARRMRAVTPRERRPAAAAELNFGAWEVEPPSPGHDQPRLTALSSAAHDVSRMAILPAGARAIQAKKLKTEPGDALEQEAERISERVMQQKEPEHEHTCTCGGTCEHCRNKHAHHAHPHLQRQAAGPATLDDARMPRVVRETLASSGRPLDDHTRATMESRFGHDFGRIRIHADDVAAQSAQAVAAHAYTVHPHVVFGAGRYAPENPDGQRLLAHELAHVVQQERGGGLMIARAGIGEMWDAFWDAGPVDAYRASKIGDEALAAAKQTGLPGLWNGPGDAWRHCYWNCRMVAEIGEEDAAEIAENHEKHGGNSTAERMMDTWNNEEGRKCSGDCDSACQAKLDAGKLWVLEDGKVAASKPTPRNKKPTVEKYDKY
jgi:hypothetical protein